MSWFKHLPQPKSRKPFTGVFLDSELVLRPSGPFDLYVKVWIFLESPTQILFDAVLDELDLLAKDLNIKNVLSAERTELQLLLCALSWLSLFESKRLEPSIRLIALLKYNIGSLDKSFKREMSFISQMTELVDGFLENAFLDSNEVHPMLEIVVENIKNHFEITKRKRAGLIVDQSSHIIVSQRQNKKIISPDFSRALMILKSQFCVPFETFAKVAFNHSYYNSDYHTQKIYNFLHGLKSYLPQGAKIVTRNQNVYLFDDSDQIHIVYCRSTTTNSRFREIWTTLMHFGSQDQIQNLSTELKVLTVFKEKKVMRRSELQIVSGLSRSSIHRLLVTFKKDGLIRPVGKGKSVVYEIVEVPV
jgi:hypothetical protein